MWQADSGPSLHPATCRVYLRGGRAGQRAKKQKDHRVTFSALGGSQFPIFFLLFVPYSWRSPSLCFVGFKRNKTKKWEAKGSIKLSREPVWGPTAQGSKTGRVQTVVLSRATPGPCPPGRAQALWLGAPGVEESLCPPLQINTLRCKPWNRRTSLTLGKIVLCF